MKAKEMKQNRVAKKYEDKPEEDGPSVIESILDINLSQGYKNEKKSEKDLIFSLKRHF
jgi:hypothetical protein